MGHFIPVSTPNCKNHECNLSLKSIIIYLGGKYKECHSGIRVQLLSDYTVGLNYIDRKCGKGYKTTIRNLMESKRKHTQSQTDYRKWKFHKQKAEKFFRMLYQVLQKMNAKEEIWLLFDRSYCEISKEFPINKLGSDIVSCPYRGALNHVQNRAQYSRDEKKAIARIVKSFLEYDKIYHG